MGGGVQGVWGGLFVLQGLSTTVWKNQQACVTVCVCECVCVCVT